MKNKVVNNGNSGDNKSKENKNNSQKMVLAQS